MPRRKLSEFRAKTILANAMGHSYRGQSSTAKFTKLDPALIATQYVVKVDQAVKGRMKRGLVDLKVPKTKIGLSLKRFADLGYTSFLIEPFVAHQSSSERYLSLTRDGHNIILKYSVLGGIDIESNPDSIKAVTIEDSTNMSSKLLREIGFNAESFAALYKAFEHNHFTFLEINPYIVVDGEPLLLDAAVELDDSGAFLTNGWSTDDLRTAMKRKVYEETIVQRLNEDSPASFNLDLINPDAGIFLLLSGGGASVVIADEIYNSGHGPDLANYGEYSGSPSREETYIYTSQVLSLLINSKAQKKTLFIGGAIANFTDIVTTFGGIIDAINERAAELSKQKVSIYVRRGGPRQEEGLTHMRSALTSNGISGEVYGPETSISQAVSTMLERFAA